MGVTEENFVMRGHGMRLEAVRRTRIPQEESSAKITGSEPGSNETSPTQLHLEMLSSSLDC